MIKNLLVSLDTRELLDYSINLYRPPEIRNPKEEIEAEENVIMLILSARGMPESPHVLKVSFMGGELGRLHAG